MMKNHGLYTVSQAADACGITVRTLHHYEQIRLLKPKYTDSKTSYRYYDIINIERIILILTLRDSGMQLSDIKTYLNGRTTAEKQLNALYAQREMIDSSVAAIKMYNAKKGVLEPEVVHMPERYCLTKRFVAADIVNASEVCHGFISECIQSGKCIIRKYHSFTEYPPEAFDEGGLVLVNFPMIICVPVGNQTPPDGAVIYPACEMAAVNYRGAYEGLGTAYEVLYDFMEHRGLVQSGNPQEVYIEGEDNADLPRDQYITRIMMPVAKSINPA